MRDLTVPTGTSRATAVSLLGQPGDEAARQHGAVALVEAAEQRQQGPRLVVAGHARPRPGRRRGTSRERAEALLPPPSPARGRGPRCGRRWRRCAAATSAPARRRATTAGPGGPSRTRPARCPWPPRSSRRCRRRAAAPPLVPAHELAVRPAVARQGAPHQHGVVGHARSAAVGGAHVLSSLARSDTARPRAFRGSRRRRLSARGRGAHDH